jgi:hypothetical protein
MLRKLSGAKRQTVRAFKRPVKQGETLHLYTGLRTRLAKKIMTAVCLSVSSVRISRPGAIGLDIRVDGVPFLENETLDFARAEGFDGADPVAAMRGFFEAAYGLPFEGQIITW